MSVQKGGKISFCHQWGEKSIELQLDRFVCLETKHCFALSNFRIVKYFHRLRIRYFEGIFFKNLNNVQFFMEA